MALTPQDVANKEFLTVRLREGYDMQEVDQFLDDVEAELRRLYDENEQLRQGLVPAHSDTAPPSATDVAAARDAADEARLSDAELRQAARDHADAPAAALTILTHAQTAADNLIDEAQSRADELITNATAKADTMVGDATQKADTLLGEATEKAERLEAETEELKAELMGDLQREENELRTRLDDLRAHEREYRSRLVAYHSEQVRRLQEGRTDDVDVEEPLAVDEIGAPHPSAALTPDLGSDDPEADYRPS